MSLKISDDIYKLSELIQKAQDLLNRVNDLDPNDNNASECEYLLTYFMFWAFVRLDELAKNNSIKLSSITDEMLLDSKQFLEEHESPVDSDLICDLPTICEMMLDGDAKTLDEAVKAAQIYKKAKLEFEEQEKARKRRERHSSFRAYDNSFRSNVRGQREREAAEKERIQRENESRRQQEEFEERMARENEKTRNVITYCSRCPDAHLCYHPGETKANCPFDKIR